MIVFLQNLNVVNLFFQFFSFLLNLESFIATWRFAFKSLVPSKILRLTDGKMLKFTSHIRCTKLNRQYLSPSTVPLYQPKNGAGTRI